MKKVWIVLFILLLAVIAQAYTVTSAAEIQSLAKKHANEDINKIMPFFGGVLFGPLAPLYQYITTPEVPANRLFEIKEMISNDQSYLLDVYVQTYRDEVKKIKANSGWLGWVSWILIVLAVNA
ncbi:hypothetical protein JYK00_07315 [Thermosipho ferrireducens]|uniref:Uncharacterized protein n=1 Tax=Thermosipho ferrireducens TaxID=2571116 RepID=A0ABX7S6R4_9BACT|nr:hypothetical protein [Thermosipho ferrireducens]QTA37536.1 hypothetical protein JYK00_07315 [Thermosipho ferrireducens]